MLTVVDLRMALEGLPDDRPVEIDLRCVESGGFKEVVSFSPCLWYNAGKQKMRGPLFVLRPGPEPLVTTSYEDPS